MTDHIRCNAVLFDLDGVLVDSTAVVERQWRAWAQSRGLSVEDVAPAALLKARAEVAR